MKEIYESLRTKVFSEKFIQFFYENITIDFYKIRKIKTYYIIWMLILLFGAIAIIIKWNNYLYTTNGTFDLGILFACLLALAVFYTIYIEHYKTRVKNIILHKIFSFLGTFNAIDSEKEQKTFDENISSLELLPKSIFNSTQYSHYIDGTYKNIPIGIIEAKLVHGCGKARETYFNGIIIRFKTEKTYNGKTVIKNKKAKIKNKKKQILIGNGYFEKYFNVETDNEIELKEVITEQLMNGLLSFNNEKLLKNLTISFENEYISIAISTSKNWFDVPFFKPINDVTAYQRILLNLAVILAIIDGLTNPEEKEG